MKKILVLVLIITSQNLLAQEFGARLKLGANFSQVDGDNMSGYNKLGANIGLEINRNINDKWDAFTEIRYSMKGARTPIQDPEDFTGFTIIMNYHYIELPLMARYNGIDRLPIYGGLSAGVNVFNQRNENGMKFQEPELLTMEYALHLGVTFEINEKWEADVRHSQSFISIRDYDWVVISPFWWGRAGWYNRLFTIGLNYKLR